jgi:TRAP transporter TAXI family solute receptor
MLVAAPTDDIEEQLRIGAAQAAFLMRPYPSPAIASILSLPGVRLWELSETERNTMRQADLFLKPGTIPAGTYGNHPSVDVLAADRVMVVRADVPEDVVIDMLTVLFDALPDLSHTVASLSGVRPDRSAAAPIPLHPGAARYYRERQLFH